ncbi:MAG TPA: hypothetical protein VLQ80_28545 [Candidatus Saccharimonadia bacterium]|nr:hypothetical protein [Candidatus Saccharimonadia bacterium]
MVTLQLRQLHVPPGERLLIEDVTWADFEAIVEELGEHRGTRVAYSQGVLEIASPLPAHEKAKVIISDLVKILLDELDMPWESLGSTTFRRAEMGSCTSWLRVIRLIQESGTMAPRYTMMRGHYHDSAPRVLPAGRHRIPLVMYHAALYLAEPKCGVPSAANGTRTHQVETHTHERAHTVCGSHPTPPLRCV